MIDLSDIHFASVDIKFAEPKDDSEPCCVQCGRVLKDGRGWSIVVAEGGAVVIDPKDWDNPKVTTDTGFMGMWDLGPECAAKTVPVYYRVRRG